MLEKWIESGQIVSNNIRILKNSCNQNIPLKTYNLGSKVYPNNVSKTFFFQAHLETSRAEC